jgi:hypothetical protein
VSQKPKKAGHNVTNAADRLVVATVTETKVHHGADHQEDSKVEISKTVTATAEARKHHRIARMLHQNQQNNEVEETGTVVSRKKVQPKVVNLPDVADEVVVAPGSE